MKTRKTNCLITIIVLFFTIFCQAQKKPGYIPPSIDDDEEIPVVKTELPVPENGKDYVVKYFKGTTDGVESRIAVKKLGYIIRHAMVQVISEDGRELAIELVKKNWDDIVRSGTTKNGTYESSFRTALEFGIKINAKEMGIPYVVVVSAGKELFPASNLFVDVSTMRSDDENKEETSMDKAELKEQEPGQSNNILYIIIAIALISILAILAVLVFKKKGKGAATLVLMLMTISINADQVKEVRPDTLKNLPNNNIEDPGDHYNNRGPDQDEPLSEDDNEHIPDRNPPGQPALPSSCYETARNNNPEASDDVGDPSISKDPTKTGGGVAGGVAGEDAAPDIDGVSGNEQNDHASLEEQLREAQRQYERDRQEARDAYDTRVKREQEDYESDCDRIRENFARARLGIDDVETLSRLRDSEAQELLDRGIEMNNRISSARELHERIMSSIDEFYENQVLRIEREFESRQQDSESVDDSEKDPNRQPKKNSNSQDDKDNTGDEHQAKGPNPPSEENPDNQKKDCSCLAKPYADLKKQQQSLEKLLKIGQHTKKVTDYGISFGDNFSGVHGVSGLVWQKQRAKVLKSIDQFDVTYKNKYRELIEKLYKVLIKIDECEKKLGYDNWYNQWGFIYYEFMRERYAFYK